MKELVGIDADIYDRILADVSPVVDLSNQLLAMVKRVEGGEVSDLENIDYINFGIHCEIAELMMQHVVHLLSDCIA